MNKYILNYSQKLNESIRKGSVLLIKGRPIDGKHHLYATTIGGHMEIKPGVIMVFINPNIYRVKYNGDGKFSGAGVDYRSEESLKGLFNMKREGHPSLVLNNKKTPFHWITTKHTDIGSALREVAPKLLSMDLILESVNSLDDTKVEQWITVQFFKYLTGRESAMIITNIVEDPKEIEEGDFDSSEDEGHASKTFDMDIGVEFYIKNKMIPSDLLADIKRLGLYDEYEEEYGTDLLELINVKREVHNFDITLMSEMLLSCTNDPGDYNTPAYHECEISKVKTDLAYIYLDGVEIEKDGDIQFKKELKLFNKFIEDYQPSEISEGIKDIMKSTYKEDNRYGYFEKLHDIDEIGVTEEIKNKWKIEVSDIIPAVTYFTDIKDRMTSIENHLRSHKIDEIGEEKYKEYSDEYHNLCMELIHKVPVEISNKLLDLNHTYIPEIHRDSIGLLTPKLNETEFYKRISFLKSFANKANKDQNYILLEKIEVLLSYIKDNKKGSHYEKVKNKLTSTLDFYKDPKSVIKK